MTDAPELAAVRRLTPKVLEQEPPDPLRRIMKGTSAITTQLRSALLDPEPRPPASDHEAQLPKSGEEVCDLRPPGLPDDFGCIYRKGHTCKCRFFGAPAKSVKIGNVSHGVRWMPPEEHTPKEEFLRSLREVDMHEELSKLASKYGVSVDEVARGAGLSVDGDTVTVPAETHRTRLAIWQRIKQLVREWSSPHAVPTTAGNFELMAMNVARVERGCIDLVDQYDLPCQWNELLEAAGETDPGIRRVWSSLDEWWETVDPDAPLEQRHDAIKLTTAFISLWMHGGFPRLEISHKYAAALCCTDCPPEIEVHAPWKAWSLVVPPDLVGEGTPSRVWAIGCALVGFVFPNGRFMTLEPDAKRRYAEAANQYVMLQNLVRGACLSLADPEQHRKKQGGQSRSKGNKRSGPPDLSLARFMLAPPVSVDLRQHVLDACSRRGGSGVPKVQFLVRGHFRQQVHGAGRALRKTIWIEPFWKGPEAGNVLLRPHKLKDDDE